MNKVCALFLILLCLRRFESVKGGGNNSFLPFFSSPTPGSNKNASGRNGQRIFFFIFQMMACARMRFLCQKRLINYVHVAVVEYYEGKCWENLSKISKIAYHAQSP